MKSSFPIKETGTHLLITLAVSRERAVKLIVEWLIGVGENDYEDYWIEPPENCVLNVAGNTHAELQS